jgi:phosphoglycolate phosphatase-like HAD superfamily hydrolase
VELLKAIIVDLDGTLCDVEHRVHHVKGDVKNWKEFNALIPEDKIYPWCNELIEAMVVRNYKILFVTGRGEDTRSMTERWLQKHSVIFNNLYMRPLGDQREDADVKEEIFINYIKDFYQVLFVLDDRKSVVDRWRELNLICLQCAPGNF